ncbi:(d)CMP kinase [Gemella sp. GH3]|uniref:(d)CMP kinase n=1 Tax=unclassified Gemella TaxID=2624949 RepID=UPI0015CF9BD6|nr:MULTISPECIES: (d)CMP kinase [unclassified Gemella]MBF0713486.1 (d)CMP kinase [Gemella sp. GH3.1]NYS50438.1 (d)CMP kinase [Gemella sp. GH3]
MYISVAIDGPAGSGKSTITKQVASDLKYNYVDTGAMYRALTYKFLKNNLYELDEEKILNILDKTNLEVIFNDGKQLVIIDGNNVTDNIRTNEISKYTSLFATSRAVRNYLIDIQRDLAKDYNVIMDGRDIGSCVLPNANVKIYLTASIEERAKRRYNELSSRDKSISLEELKKIISERDYQDSNRKIAPLIKSADAILVDTTNMTISQVVIRIKDIIAEKIKGN